MSWYHIHNTMNNKIKKQIVFDFHYLRVHDGIFLFESLNIGQIFLKFGFELLADKF